MPRAPAVIAGGPSIVISLTTPPDCFGSRASSFASASAISRPIPVVRNIHQRATGHYPSALEVTAEALQSEEAALPSGG